MTATRLLLVGAAVLLLCRESCAVGAEERAIAPLYERAVRGDKTAVEECIATLEKIVKQAPRNQLARVYLGSCYTLRSRDLGFGPTKLQTLRLGLATMDEAVNAAPDQPRVRLVRALTTDALPALLGRKKSARQDFDELARIAQQDPSKLSENDLRTIREHAR